MIELVKYDYDFLMASRKWLSDPIIKKMTLASDIDPIAQEEWFKNLENRKDYIIFGVVFEGEKIGALGIKNIDINIKSGEYWGYIGEKKYWGRGIGSQMLKEMIKSCKSMSIERLYLKVRKDNIRAIQLYKKNGFEIFEESIDMYLMDKYFS